MSFDRRSRSLVTPEIQDMLDSHPSLAASLEDFEHQNSPQASPGFGAPSQHSGFAEESESEAESSGRWSPAAWRKDPSGWFAPPKYPTHSRSESYDSEVPFRSAYSRTRSAFSNEILTAASRVPLPPSPERQLESIRNSEEPEGDTTLVQSPSPARTSPASPASPASDGPEDDTSRESSEAPEEEEKKNYFRFGMHAEVQHRTDILEEILDHLKGIFGFVFQSWYHCIGVLLATVLATGMLKSLIAKPTISHAPDLLKAVGVINSFEPLIIFSERGMSSVNEIQDTGIAVYDLSESVRHSNMSSAPMLVNEMDNLSDSLKVLAIEMTRFFANVNGDVDGMLIVIDWSRRELIKANSGEIGTISAAFTNVHDALTNWGVFEQRGRPTKAGQLFTNLFGMTPTQRTKAAMRRSFNSFLDLLEEAIRNELQHATQLFGLFEAVERTYSNVASTCRREMDTQAMDEGEYLARLWTRLIGADSQTLKKFTHNRGLLAAIAHKTQMHKTLVREQQLNLMRMRSDMERLRRTLVSPLVRSEGQLLSVEEQIDGLVEAHGFLRAARERARRQGFQLLMESGKGRSSLTTEGAREIESGPP